MAPPQARGAQAQTLCIPCGLKVAPEDCAAHQELSDRRRTWASEKDAIGHLRWHFSQPVPAAQNRCFNRCGLRVLLLFCHPRVT